MFPGASIADWTELQVHLCAFTTFYDGLNESFEKPPDTIIRDDVLLDNWLKELKAKQDLERERKWAGARPGGLPHPKVPGDIVTGEQLQGAANLEELVRRGGTFVFNNPQAPPVMILTEPTQEEMAGIIAREHGGNDP